MKHIHSKPQPYKLGAHIVKCICHKTYPEEEMPCPYRHVVFYVEDVEEMHQGDIFHLKSIGKYSYSDNFFTLDSDGHYIETSISEQYLETL